MSLLKLGIEDRVKLCRQADKEYYTDGSSSLCDLEYDQLKDSIREEDPDNEYLEEVGAEDIDESDWSTCKHEYPIGSLNKVNSIEQLKKWADIKKHCYLVQPKLDGISIAMTFENGELIRAVTRGKRGVGFDITRNVKKMKGVPEKISIKEKLVVRGEILMTFADFKSLPDDKKKKNPRNTAAGAAKKRNGELCGYLTVIVYDILNHVELGISLESEVKINLHSYGFPNIVSSDLCVNIHDLESTILINQDNRSLFEYDIDGLVIKTEKINVDDDWKNPKSKIAYKFPAQEVHTTLESIKVQVKGNRIQPVAIVAPVDIGGVTVSKASLHHWKRVESMNLSYGAKVLISRRNDVIPQIEQVLESTDNKVEIPTNCPVCDSVLKYEINTDGTESPFLCCFNENCDAKITKHITKWLEVHETKGVAVKTIELLYENGIFTDLASFLKLHLGEQDQKIVGLEGMGQSKLDILKTQIKTTLKTDPIKFFAGLNLNGFGRGMFENICEYIMSYQDKADYTDVLMTVLQPFSTGLSNVEGFARPSAEKLRSTVESRLDSIRSVYSLVDIDPCANIVSSSNDNFCAGKSFCFTGTLEIVRKDAEKLVKSQGGKVSSVSKTLDFLVTDDPVDAVNGTNKMVKACKLGIKIITGNEFYEMVDRND